jgi:hypothetical protein
MSRFRIPGRIFTSAAIVSLAILCSIVSPPRSASADTFTWTGGTFVPGVTAPSPMTFPDILEINDGPNKIFNASAWTNQSTVVWNADTLFLQNAASINNEGRWEARGDNTLANNGGALSSFTNTGHFLKSAGTGTTSIGSIRFVSSGMIEAQSGIINFNGGNVTFNNGSQFLGAGSITVGNNATFNSAFNSSNLSLGAGTFTGNAAVINGAVNYTGGIMTGDWQIASGQTLTANTGANKIFNAVALTNNGTLRWNTTQNLFMQNASTVVNNALHEVHASSSLANNGGAVSSYTNSSLGTLRVASGRALTVGSIAFINDGGRLDAEGTIHFSGGNATFNTGTVFTGAGSNLVTTNAAFNGSITSSNLLLQAGTYTGTSALLQGTTAYSGGVIAGTWEVPANQTLSALTGGNKILNSAAITNKGTANWQTADTFYLQNASSFLNQGTFNLLAGATLANNGGGLSNFTNSGTFAVPASQSGIVGTIAFINNAGTLAVDGQVNFSGGNATFNAGSIFSGSGAVILTNNATFNGAFSSANLSLRAGTFTGNDAISSGAVEFIGGTLTGEWDTGTATWTALGPSNKFINAATVSNNSTINWQTGSTLFMLNGATLINRGVFEFQTGATVANNGGAIQTFDNRNILRVAPGQGAIISTVAFVNNGGTIDVGAGGQINFSGGNATFNAGTQFTGAGLKAITNSATFNGPFSAINLSLQGGNFRGNAAALSGSADFFGDTFTGTWTVAPGATLSAVSTRSKFLDNVSFTNQGTIAWNTPSALFFLNNARLFNHGTIDLAADSNMLHNGGAVGSFINNGLIIKSAGAGTTSITNNLGFDNRGVLNVSSGTIHLPDNFTNNGTLKGIGTFTTNTLTNAGHLAPGNSPGTLRLNGNYAQTASGSFDVELETLLSSDLFLVGGNSTLAGTLALSCFGNCNFAVGDELVILDAVGQLTGTFSNVTKTGFATGEFDVIYDTAADRVLLRVTEAVTPEVVPEPHSLVLILLAVAAATKRRRRPARR